MRTSFNVLKLLTFLFFGIANSGSAGAESYYVDATNGNDSNTGISHSQAWKTLGKVNKTSFNVGDDVYLHCGSTFNKQYLSIDWSGTNENRVVVGAYYMNDGLPVIGVNDSGKPIIDGEQTFPSIGSFLGLVNASAPYVTIQDLNLKKSEQYGINANYKADYLKIQRNVIESTYWGSIFIGGGANYATIVYNKCTDSGRKMLVPTLPWCGAIETYNTTGSSIQYNYIKGSHGEGIGVGSQSNVKYNTVLDCYSVFYYVSHQNNVEVAYNLALGTSDSVYLRGNSWYGRAFDVGNEAYITSKEDKGNIKIHHNTAINCNSGFRFAIKHSTYKLDYVYVYNNTWIDCRYSLRIDNNATISANQHVWYKNNISYPKHQEANHMVIFGNDQNGALSNWVCENNVWALDTPPTHVDISGTNDMIIDPSFSKKSWRGTINTIKDFYTNDFVPTNMNIIAGKELGDQYQFAILPDSNFNTEDPDPNIGSPITINLSNLSSNSPWPIGSIDFSNAKTISPPKGVVASGNSSN